MVMFNTLFNVSSKVGKMKNGTKEMLFMNLSIRQFLRTVILYFIEKLFGVSFSDDCNAKRILYGRRIYAVSIKE